MLLTSLQTKWVCEDLERIAIDKKQKIEKIHKEPGQSNGQLVSTTVADTKEQNQFEMYKDAYEMYKDAYEGSQRRENSYFDREEEKKITTLKSEIFIKVFEAYTA